MGKLRGTAIAAALISTSLVAAPAASGAVEAGNNSCTANRAQTDAPVFQAAVAGGGTIPVQAPTGGIVTKWKLTVVSLEGMVAPQRVQVFRPTGNPNEFKVVGESADASVTGGQQTFDTRIPVAAGDHFGLFGAGKEIGSLYCETKNPLDVGFAFPSPTPVGTTQTFVEVKGLGVPVSVLIEADADNDGYGDESQDKCPQNATTQAACPVAILDSFAVAGKNTVTVIVSSSFATPVTVSGTAALPKSKKGKAGSSAQAKLKAVTKTVTPGTIGRFKLKLPAKLRSAVAALAPGKALTLKLTASATSVAGAVSTDKLNLKLK